eukprot:6938889-Pyramimonas_sp.AAC.1
MQGRINSSRPSTKLGCASQCQLSLQLFILRPFQRGAFRMILANPISHVVAQHLVEWLRRG